MSMTYVQREYDGIFKADDRWPQSAHRAAADFPVGTRVRIVCKGQDFMFFHGDETGEVIRNRDRYLGITVKFDVPIYVIRTDAVVPKRPTKTWLERHASRLDDFNFEPADLIIEGEPWT